MATLREGWNEAISHLKDLDPELGKALDEKFGGSALLKRAEAVEALEAERANLEAERRSLTAQARVREVLGDLERSGVDVIQLRRAERQEIARRLEGVDEVGEDWVANIVSELGLPMRGVGK